MSFARFIRYKLVRARYIRGSYCHASLQRAELKADYSSVRASVRGSVPLLGEAQNLCFCTILSEILENHLCILRYLALVALKKRIKLILFS